MSDEKLREWILYFLQFSSSVPQINSSNISEVGSFYLQLFEIDYRFLWANRWELWYKSGKSFRTSAKFLDVNLPQLSRDNNWYDWATKWRSCTGREKLIASHNFNNHHEVFNLQCLQPSSRGLWSQKRLVANAVVSSFEAEHESDARRRNSVTFEQSKKV